MPEIQCSPFAYTKFDVGQKNNCHFVRGELFLLQMCCHCEMNDLPCKSTAYTWCWSPRTIITAYPELLHSPLRRLGVVPQFDHRHGHRLIKDHIHTVHLQPNSALLKPLACPANPAAERHSPTCPGSTGANHMCLPSLVLLTSSISLSGVLTSPLTLSRTLTLSGKAAMSGAHRDVEEHTRNKRHTIEATGSTG